MNWESYHSIEEIYNYLDFVAEANDDVASVEVYGTSSEGRPLKALKIKSPKAKQAIFIEAGIHAREWITPATATYIINQLFHENNTAVRENFDWIIVPSTNPDGYEYSRTTNRLWRKTRSGSRASKIFQETGKMARSVKQKKGRTVASYRKLFECLGVDGNRNWDFHWREGGSSIHSCSETYAGSTAFSEPETKSLSEYILKNTESGKFTAYFAIHSYSQMWLLPWGYTKNTPEDIADLKRLAKIGAEALRSVHGTNFRIGTTPGLLYIASGSSNDWAKGVAGIKYAYTLELRDKGYYGFLLPPKYILPTAEETWNAIKACANELVT
ncbi:hypothetical protein QYM36_011835 [Artemia franciscana]|nr:hypothetical protein QYM36_011835 [Artemia franciscana]